MHVNSVAKKYRSSVVLNGISFDFKQGEIVGLIGSNGAGKSTLMKIIAQTIQTFDGSVEDNNHVGYLIEEPKLYSNKTGLAHLSYFSEIYGNKFKLSEYEELLKGLQLFDVLNKKVKEYSLGMRQKLGIVISLLNKPSYVVLDEPTNSMDIETSLEVLQQLRKMANVWNVGVLISSHKLEDIETICDRVLFLEKGTISEEQQFSKSSQYILKLVFDNPTDLTTFIENQEFGSIIHSSEKTIQIETTAENTEIFQFLNQLGIRLIDFNAEKKTLRNVYMNKLRGEDHDPKYQKLC
ncbi:ABC transporter ATP-binding protein [Bacillus atrophaeus]|uniref:ABC transporter ATP-binding protein n=1 Tax=Bacillus atrophaeus TaxID=1452 RepID=UPI00227D9A22|nr:ABC transporter ATP-binding protein [Bacillus atrophaeus]MCY8463605.1 ABC transporter ATP-binding protein [Bacillus atrophaeus]MCY8477118.1 ABC transporter ATP-binding protein [Bacillus atrophaeus]MCY8915153.1 ABC transporter ATP-binding protein [Bacillus atrophaeus]MCY8924811.1 ABC transporter ATP-binding protein [Bacillus atrophaeus]MCY8961322.1 ABC transporter ATP-binding protein [Bacillus atrophaeus]